MARVTYEPLTKIRLLMGFLSIFFLLFIFPIFVDIVHQKNFIYKQKKK